MNCCFIPKTSSLGDFDSINPGVDTGRDSGTSPVHSDAFISPKHIYRSRNAVVLSGQSQKASTLVHNSGKTDGDVRLMQNVGKVQPKLTPSGPSDKRGGKTQKEAAKSAEKTHEKVQTTGQNDKKDARNVSEVENQP